MTRSGSGCAPPKTLTAHGAAARLSVEPRSRASCTVILRRLFFTDMQGPAQDAQDRPLIAGLSTCDGRLTSEPMARDLGLPYTPAELATT
jgi:hypothetical protein